MRFSTITHCSLSALLVLSLAACGGSDDDTAPEAPPAPPVTSPGPEPVLPGDPDPEPVPPSPWLSAQTGDVLKVTIGALHPTQAAVGYDQIYYHLGRKQPDLGRFTPSAAGYLGDDADDNYSRYLYRSERKRGDDYCADNGQGGLNDLAYQPHTLRLIDATTFRCSEPEPNRDSVAAAALKTVVVGPEGQLYLTDGHHTFTTLNELADGGEALPVWVRVAANYSDSDSMPAFWARMEAANYVWLRDAADQPIDPSSLPRRVALGEFQDDAYRSLIYLTRDMGYSNANVSEFAEFSWGSWLRKQGLDLTAYALQSLDRSRITVTPTAVEPRAGDSATSYVAAVRDAALFMVNATPQTMVGADRTAADLGQLALPTSASDWNDIMEDDVWRADVNGSGRYRTAGKAWYAVKYRQCEGSAATHAECWLLPVR